MTLIKFLANEKPKLRDTVIVYAKDNIIKMNCMMEFKEVEYEAYEFVKSLIPLLDGQNTLKDIELKLINKKDFSSERLQECLSMLYSDGLMYGKEYANWEKKNHDKKFDRQLLLFEELKVVYKKKLTALQMQEKLQSSEISIIGAGGLGTWVISSLVSAGIGKIKVFDPDIIEKTNLNRQVTYNSNDINKHKVDVIREKANVLNSETKLETFKININSIELIENNCKTSDLVINCGDFPDVMTLSDLIAVACENINTPYIVGGGYSGNLAVPGVSVIPSQTISWREMRKQIKSVSFEEQYELIKGSSSKYGNMAPIAGLTGNIMAWEAIKIILDFPLSLANVVKELDIFSLEWKTRKFIEEG